MNITTFDFAGVGQLTGLEGYLKGVSFMHGQMHPDWVAPGMEGLILRHGREYTVSGPQHRMHHYGKQCFANAYNVARLSRGKLLYVEGVVECFGIAIHHAWVADAKTGQGNDPTLGEPERIGRYFGIAFDFDWVNERTSATKAFGVFGHFADRAQFGWMRTGNFPANALACTNW